MNLTDNARRVLEARYLARDANGKVVETPEQLFRRVADAVAEAERKYGGDTETVKRWSDEFYRLMTSLEFLPNSPTLMNAGRSMGMLSACFVLPVGDSIEEIFEAVKATALVQKAGGGTGFSFDRLRPSGDIVTSSGGRTSGPLSFWRVLSEATCAIQQGAFRRGANMGMMSVDHPDILKFVLAKSKPGAFTNYNVSVKVTDEFMEQLRDDPGFPLVVKNQRTSRSYLIPKAVDPENYQLDDLHGRTGDERVGPASDYWSVGDLFDLIVKHAHATGEPGLCFIDAVNRANPTPHVGEMESTNPCLTAETKVWTVAHGAAPIGELANIGRPIEVWTIDQHGQVVPTMLRNIRRTRENADLVRVTFGTGTSIRCTPEHGLYPVNTLIDSRAAADLIPGRDRVWGAYNIPGRPGCCGESGGFEAYDYSIAKVEHLEEREDVYCGVTDHPDHRFLVSVGPDRGVLVANCGEQPLLPYEACNLGSINLAALVRDGGNDGRRGIDLKELKRVIAVAVRFLDNVVDVNRYPLPEIAAVCHANRKTGLGVMGFADALFAAGIPYDSDEALENGRRLASYLQSWAHEASEALARERGSFPNWEGSTWEQKQRLMRNACTTTVAPTGTISIIANCSGGIEPLFALAFTRNVLDGQRLTEVNPEFQRAMLRRQVGEDFLSGLTGRLAEGRSLQDEAGVPDDLKDIFKTARDVSPTNHVLMQAAWQKYCDSAVSKTINLPPEATEDAVRDAYVLAWLQGCKGITVYRDGSRAGQPMANEKKEPPSSSKEDTVPGTAEGSAGDSGKKPGEGGQRGFTVEDIANAVRLMREAGAQPTSLVWGQPGEPMPLPEVLPAVRVRQRTPFGNLHVSVGVHDGTPREVFAQLGKGGDLAAADLEAICRMISLYLRSGGTLARVVEQLSGIGSSLTIPTKEGRVASLADGLARALARYEKALADVGIENLLLGNLTLGPNSALEGSADMAQEDGSALPHNVGSQAEVPTFRIVCPDCEEDLVREGGCMECKNCGWSKC